MCLSSMRAGGTASGSASMQLLAAQDARPALASSKTRSVPGQAERRAGDDHRLAAVVGALPPVHRRPALRGTRRRGGRARDAGRPVRRAGVRAAGVAAARAAPRAAGRRRRGRRAADRPGPSRASDTSCLRHAAEAGGVEPAQRLVEGDGVGELRVVGEEREHVACRRPSTSSTKPCSAFLGPTSTKTRAPARVERLEPLARTAPGEATCCAEDVEHLRSRRRGPSGRTRRSTLATTGSRGGATCEPLERPAQRLAGRRHDRGVEGVAHRQRHGAGTPAACEGGHGALARPRVAPPITAWLRAVDVGDDDVAVDARAACARPRRAARSTAAILPLSADARRASSRGRARSPPRGRRRRAARPPPPARRTRRGCGPSPCRARCRRRRAGGSARCPRRAPRAG